MKKSIIILTLLLSNLSFFAQDLDLDAKYIHNTITSPDGGFYILNTDASNSLKFWLKANGQVNWYLDGEDMFIRDGHFEAFPDIFTKYDFLHIDGENGRIGFNILGDPVFGELPLTSSIHLMGSIATRVRILDGTNSYAIKQDDHIMIIDKNSGSTSSMELPAVSTSKGREYTFKRNGNNDGKIELKPQTGEKLNGVVNGEIILSQDNASLEVVCDGDGWWSLSELSVQIAVTSVSSSSTPGVEDFIEVVFTSNVPIVITLPDVASYEGQVYEIKRNDDGNTYTNDLLSIKPATGQKLDTYTEGSPYEMPNDWESVKIRSDGSIWLILSNYGH